MYGAAEDDSGYYGEEEAGFENEDTSEWAQFESAEDDDVDPDACAYVDEEGYFHASQEVIDEVDAQIGLDDPEYQQAVMSCKTSRGILSQARVAHGFYPGSCTGF